MVLLCPAQGPWASSFLMKGICTRNYKGFCVAVNKSYVPFTCKFPMVMHFVLILHKCCRSENNFYVSNYDLTSSKYCKSSSLEFSIFTEKFTKIGLKKYVDRGIASCSWWLVSGSRSKFGNWTTVSSVYIFKLSIVT